MVTKFANSIDWFAGSSNLWWAFYSANLVAGPGIEPGTVAYETTVLPLHYPAIYLVEEVGFEPTSLLRTDLQSAAPLQLRRSSMS